MFIIIKWSISPKLQKLRLWSERTFYSGWKYLSNDTNIGTFVQSRKYWSKVVPPTGTSCVKIRSKLQKLIYMAKLDLDRSAKGTGDVFWCIHLELIQFWWEIVKMVPLGVRPTCPGQVRTTKNGSKWYNNLVFSIYIREIPFY